MAPKKTISKKKTTRTTLATKKGSSKGISNGVYALGAGLGATLLAGLGLYKYKKSKAASKPKIQSVSTATSPIQLSKIELTKRQLEQYDKEREALEAQRLKNIAEEQKFKKLSTGILKSEKQQIEKEYNERVKNINMDFNKRKSETDSALRELTRPQFLRHFSLKKTKH